MSKIYFQGTYGAYSHLAALEVEPNAEIIPCKTFDECFLKASSENGSRIVIPESNRITGNIGIEYLIFKYIFWITIDQKFILIPYKIESFLNSKYENGVLL